MIRSAPPLPPRPTLLSGTHDFLGSAARHHASAGYDWPTYFDSFWENGYVFKAPTYFMLGYADDKNDAWIIWYLESTDPSVSQFDLLAKFLRMMPHYRPKIGWARALKNKPFRFYSTERMLRFIA